MRKYRQNRRRRRTVGAGSGATLSPLQGLTVEPPPKETGNERLYRVVYMIDIGASNPQQAAKNAYEIMKDPQSMRPVLDVLDAAGRCTRVDLSDQ
jgi:hypothetical protein